MIENATASSARAENDHHPLAGRPPKRLKLSWGATPFMLDVDYQTVIDYPGNYTSFLEQKEQTRERKEVEIARTERIVAEKKAFIERFRYKASKARQAQSRVKALAKMQPIAAEVEDRVVPFRLNSPAKELASPLIQIENASVGYAPGVPMNGRAMTRETSCGATS